MSKRKEMTDYIQIGDNYRITSDKRHNLMLHKQFEKTDGRGKNARGTGEFEYKNIGYFKQLEHIGRYLARLEELENIDKGLESATKAISNLEESVVEAMKSVDVTWASMKE